MCMDRDAVARLRQAGDDEGKISGVQGEGRCGGGGEITVGARRRGVTTPRQRVVPITDRVTNRRVDEGDCGMARGGNEG